MEFIDLKGRRFGRLTVIKYDDKDKWGAARWLCRCDCGKEKIINGKSLRRGVTKSCGCVQHKIEHGHSSRGKKSKIYHIWQAMKQRCNNPNNRAYKNYGGRTPPIMVCKRWLKFENFYKDVGDPPRGLTLDRINNNKGYFPNNWRWATRKEQANNKRNNIHIPFKNKTWNMDILAQKHNINPSTLGHRLNKGMSIEEALMTPIRKRIKNK